MTATQNTSSPTVREAPRPRRRWPIWLFRITMTAAAILAFNQAVFAGQFLSGTYPALGLHRDMANYTVAAIASSIITAIIWRRAAAGPRWLVTAAVAVFILTALQTFLGYRLILAVHIPLGVIVILLLVTLTTVAWRPTR